MTTDTETKLVPVRPAHLTERDAIWMIGIFVFTPLAAMALAITSHIPTSPLIAAIDGLLVSYMYVGFRIVNAWRRQRLHSKIVAEIEEETEVTV